MATTASCFVSVLMCSGPTSGRIFACPATYLVHRRKKLDIGAHVLVRHQDGRRRKGVIVHMNPFSALINGALATRPVAPAPAIHVKRTERRCKPVTSLNPGRPFRHEPAPSPVGVTSASLNPSKRYPGRHRVRRELNFSGPKRGSKVRSIKAPFTMEELDGVVPLDLFSEFDADRDVAGPLASVPRIASPASVPSASPAPVHTSSPAPIPITSPAPVPTLSPVPVPRTSATPSSFPDAISPQWPLAMSLPDVEDAPVRRPMLDTHHDLLYGSVDADLLIDCILSGAC